jgi:amino acid adenylation domain-containing protein
MEIDKKNIEDIFALTPMQEGLLFHYLKNPRGLQYHQQLCLVVSGRINREFFAKAWNFVIEKNEMLRAVFRWKKVKEPLQAVLKNSCFKPRYHDLSDRNDKKNALTEIKTRDRETIFDFREVPFRVTLCKVEQELYEMMISHHHILFDGWSYGIILKEFFNAYHSLYLGKESSEVMVARRKFKEFVNWIYKQDKQAQERYWTSYLQGFTGGSGLSLKKEEAADPGAVDKWQMTISGALDKQARQMTREKNVTLASLFYGAWGILLQKYNDETDVVFGITASGRTAPIQGIESIVGLFINTAPLRMNYHPDDHVCELIGNINRDLQDRKQYENTPLVDIKKYSEISAKENLFGTIMVIENYPVARPGRQENGNLEILQHSTSEITGYDLTVVVEAFEDLDTGITFIYHRESFEKEFIRGISHRFTLIFNDMINNPGKKLKQIEMVTAGEKARIVDQFNRTEAAYPGDRLIHEWIEQKAKKTPGKTALIGMGQGEEPCHPSFDLTYGEFNRRANQLGSFLRGKGVGPDKIIHIMAERSLEILIGMFGILKAGGAYLPIDPQTPDNRLRHLLADSQAKILLVQDKFAGRLNKVISRLKTSDKPGVLSLEAAAVNRTGAPDLPLITKPGNLVYVLYTSGSTGTPKGVLIRHFSLVNRLNWMQKKYPLDENDVIMQKTPVIFDVSLWELFWWTMAGASLCLIKSGDEKDPQALVEAITKNKITTLHFVPSMLTLFLDYIEAASAAGRLQTLSRVFASGEALGPLQAEMFDRQLYRKNKTKLINLYGPTEATVDVSYYDCIPGEKTGKIPIGKPLDNIKLWVVNRGWQMQPVGLPGELAISGSGLARGYLNNPELTAEKFIDKALDSWLLAFSRTGRAKNAVRTKNQKKTSWEIAKTGSQEIWANSPSTNPLNPCPTPLRAKSQKLRGNSNSTNPLRHYPTPLRAKSQELRATFYKTGDLARWLAGGDLEFLGRIDHQVKIRGFRIELGEIEERLCRHQEIKEAVVVKSGNEQEFLDAYFVSNSELNVSQLRDFLSRDLPEYMIPSSFTRLETLVRLRNGKVDRGYLPARDMLRPNLGVTFVTPGNEAEKRIAGIWKDILRLDKVGIHDNFFDLGGNSLMIIRVNSRLAVEFGKDISMAMMFRCPTIHSLARCLAGNESDTGDIEPGPELADEENKENRPRDHRGGAAVIGMAGKFPGAGNLDEFWENLKDGKESITFFTKETMRKSGVEENLLRKPNYVNAQGVLPDLEYFDAGFFGYTPREAEIMDPQLRIFHECAWEVLEDAGYPPGAYNGIIGLYAGASPNLYWEALAAFSRKIEVLGVFTAEKLMNKDYLTKWISYKLNLKGPSLSIYTACSTSLVALHLACRALADNECDMALVGGVTTAPLPDKTGYLYQEGMVLSPDGHCRAFDAQSGGFVGGKGAGIVLLKPLAKAEQDKDNIYAVIKGSAINNDGIRKVGFSAPSVEGQIETVKEALKRAGIPAESIGYIDAHGTGTELGDPVEIEALTLAFATGKKGFCGIGSAKTNIGHLDTAAGIASLIKVVLALKHRKIPPGINFNIPNPRIDFIDSPFYVNTNLVEWENGSGPLRAGVNSLGIGGTNAHVILEEWPINSPGEICPGESAAKDKEYQLILLSAKTSFALDKQRENLAAYLRRNPGIHFADAAYTLQVGRRFFPHREIHVSGSIHQAYAALSAPTSPPRQRFFVNGGAAGKHVVFIFSKTHPHLVNHGLESYRRHSLFAREVERGLARLNVVTTGLNGTLSGDAHEAAAAFIFQYALARWLMKMGVKPDAMAGDYWGEYTAACLSGVFSPEDAMELVISRNYLPENPGENSFRATYLEKVKEKLGKISWGKPSIPFISTITGKWAAPEQTVDFRYWLDHLCRENKSWPDASIKELSKEENLILIRLGAGDVVKGQGETLKHHRPRHREPLLVNMLTAPREGEPANRYLLKQLGHLWLYGLDIDWSAFHHQEKRNRISLPTYPFERQRYWIEGNPFKFETMKSRGDSAFRKQTDLSRWFYIPLWKQSGPLPTAPRDKETDETGTWLVFRDEINDQTNLGSSLVNQLEKEGEEVITIAAGGEFARSGEHSYIINPQQATDYELLFNNLQGLDRPVNNIVHLWGITGKRDGEREPDPESVNRQQIFGFYSLLYIARALGKQNFTREIRVTVLTDNMQEVSGEEVLDPGKATVLGPCKVIPQEFSHIRCSSIDLVPPGPGTWQQEKIVEQLLAEFRERVTGKVVAYRNNCRWIRIFEPIPLENPGTKNSRLRPGGIYLVIGGLGGVGLILAEYLAREVQARLVLTGRSSFPAPEEWEQWLNSHEQDHSISIKIRKIQEFEKLGARVIVSRSDTANETHMREVVARVEAQWGPINGVIHAAAAGEDSLFKTINEVEPSDCTDQFKPKMQGILVLEKVLKEKNPDFCLLMSSTASVLGGLGFCAYSAANNFMDAFARRHNRLYSQKWLAVNWEGWQLENRRFRFAFKTMMEELLMTPEEGIEVFKRLLTHPEIAEVLISSGNLQSRIEKWIKQESLATVEAVQARKALSCAYIPPDSQQEKIIAGVWQEFFALDRVGADDNLFELGATSLDIIQLNANLRKALKKNIPILTLFTYPTVRSLARNLFHEETAAGTPGTKKQRTYRLETSKQSMQTRQNLRKRLKNSKHDQKHNQL